MHKNINFNQKNSFSDWLKIVTDPMNNFQEESDSPDEGDNEG